jgi:hypothetical protein
LWKVVAESRGAGAASLRAEESAEQKFAREAGERIMQAIALSQFAAELRAAGAAAGLHSATSPTAAKGAAGDSARAGAPVRPKE